MILALETSCDDTCAALLGRDGAVRANVISSQGIHERYGGVVPEVASRHHLELINAVIAAALDRAAASLDDVSLVAVTVGPGLIGALLVGVSAAKAVAAVRALPLAPVDHLQGHVAANFLDPEPIEPPFVCLIASGGHTLLAEVSGYDGFRVLGRTLDDAAGEAFDKGARLLGLSYPGGPALEALARGGDPEAFPFPGRDARSARSSEFGRSLDFSFAGLKTALRYRIAEMGNDELARRRSDLAASYQRAIVESLASRSERALERTGLDRLAVGGGVAANGPLRQRLSELGVEVKIPPPELCTDNAAMIASAARFGVQIQYPGYLELDAYPTGVEPALVRGPPASR